VVTAVAARDLAFIGAILRGEPVLSGPDDAVANMTVIDACYAAAGPSATRTSPMNTSWATATAPTPRVRSQPMTSPERGSLDGSSLPQAGQQSFPSSARNLAGRLVDGPIARQKSNKSPRKDLRSFLCW
jgi:hypothetical protein